MMACSSSAPRPHSPYLGRLIVIAGPSGVGKGTLIRHLMSHIPNVVHSISATTRPPRPGEEDGREYFFKSPEAFKAMVAENAFLEWAEFAGNLYGTPLQAMIDERQAGNHVILEIEAQGAAQIRERCPDAYFIFVAPPSMDTLRERLEHRATDAPDVIERRLKQAEWEMTQLHLFDFIVINDQLENAQIALLSAVQHFISTPVSEQTSL